MLCESVDTDISSRQMACDVGVLRSALFLRKSEVSDGSFCEMSVETKVLAITHATIYTENTKRYYKDGEFGVNNVSTLYPCTKEEYFEWKREYDEKHKTIRDRIREILKENEDLK